MAEIKVHLLDLATDANWSFRDSQLRWQHGAHGSSGTFDPFPAYGHDIAEVERTAKHVAGCCPPLWDVDLFVANREETGRTNGYSSIVEPQHQDDDGKWVRDAPVGLIVLSGKRIPPHPATTRYLVAHEYGHNVFWMIGRARDPARSIYSEDWLVDYATMRGLPTPVHAGSGGRWHDSASEVFACDFRMIVCRVEPDYWPHPGIPQPFDDEVATELAQWWGTALEDLGAARLQRPDDEGAA